MTAIAGIVEDGKVWIGGDALSSNQGVSKVCAAPKVFVNGEFLIGYTSSFRMGQLLEYELSPPTPHEGENGMGFMVRQFIPAVKSTLQHGGYQRNRDGEDFGGVFIVGYRGELYRVDSDFHVAEYRQNYLAIGCGEDFLLGSLHTTEQFELPPQERIQIALDAAAEHCSGVRGPHTIKSL